MGEYGSDINCAKLADEKLLKQEKQFTYEIVQATGEHISFIHELETACFEQPWPLEFIYEDVVENRNLYYVLISEGKPIAYAGMWIILDEAHITNICVHPNYRRMGLGRVLINTLFKEAAKRDVDNMSLEVRVSNDAALRLYKSEGFTIDGKRKKYYSDTGEDAYIMWKRGLSDYIS